jgi:hypothetical protein
MNAHRDEKVPHCNDKLQIPICFEEYSTAIHPPSDAIALFPCLCLRRCGCDVQNLLQRHRNKAMMSAKKAMFLKTLILRTLPHTGNMIHNIRFTNTDTRSLRMIEVPAAYVHFIHRCVHV